MGAKTAFDFVIEQQQKFPKNRGPFLAQIEVQTRVLARSGGGSDCFAIDGDLCKLLIDYFLRFGSKPACALDLKLYLPSVGKESINRFFDETLKFIEFDEKQVPASVSKLCI
jgi:hypothetical protein